MIIPLFKVVVMMLVYMLLGYMLCKSKLAVVSHAKSISALLLFVLSPAMIINSFLKLEYSAEGLFKLATYFLVTLIVQALFFFVLYLAFRKRFDDAKYRIMTIGGVLGNVGYIGMPILQCVFPDEPIVLCYSSVNVMSMNLIVFTIGVYMITTDKSYVSIKHAILNPTSIALIISLPLYIFGIHFIDEVESSIELLGKMVTPVCMFILGMRLSEAKLKDLFTRKFVYIACALKLIVFPVFAFLLMRWMPLDLVLKTSVVVLAMVPSGVIIETLAELHECNQEFAANVVLLTTILSVVTVPVMAFLLV